MSKQQDNSELEQKLTDLPVGFQIRSIGTGMYLKGESVEKIVSILQKEVEKARETERKECIKAFEQKMTNLGVKWGRIHKAACECGESGCLTPSQQNKERE